MSSSSFVDILEDHEGANEFPFPVIESRPPRSLSSGSDSTPPYMSRSLPEHRSSSSSSRRQRRTHHDHDRDRVRDRERERERDDRDRESTPAKLLYRLAAREELRDTKHIRTLLVLTNDRLEAETRRADQAEQRVVDVLHRLRTANEATALAQSDAARAQQDVRLYQIQLQQAQREITRAEDTVEQVERLRRDAEEEAARARTIARKCREDLVLSRAREEGRKQGYQEGLERGRKLGFTEAQLQANKRTAPPARLPPRSPPPLSDSDSESMEIDVEEPQQPAEPERRAASVPVPEVHRASPPHIDRPPVPRAPSRAASRPPPQRTSDVGTIGIGLPVPTVATPLNLPSPSHTRPPSPRAPLPVPEPRARPSDITPVVIHEAPRSPAHQHYDIPPDNWIPYAPNNDTSSIMLPPPHEMSRPVTPVDPSPAPSEALPLPPPSIGSRETIVPIAHSTPGSQREPLRLYEPTASVRSRDYAYPAGPSRSRPPTAGMMSPQSRTSTRISEYDILGRPHLPSIYRQEGDRDSLKIYKEREPSMRRGSTSRESPASSYFPQVAAGPSDESSRPIYTRHATSESSRGPSESSRGPLEKLFRKRSKSKRSTERDSHPVPDITVESASTDDSRESTAVATQPELDLLSPDYAVHALPVLVDTPAGLPKPQPHSQPQHHNPLPPFPTATIPNLKPGSPYAEAPLPPNVTYPSAPGRSKSRASERRVPVPVAPSSEDTGDSLSYRSRKRAGSVADSLSFGGRLSPLSLFNTK